MGQAMVGVVGEWMGMRVVVDDGLPARPVRHDLPAVSFPIGWSSGHREWRRLVKERRKHARLVSTTDAVVIGGQTIIVTSEMWIKLIEEIERS